MQYASVPTRRPSAMTPQQNNKPLAARLRFEDHDYLFLVEGSNDIKTLAAAINVKALYLPILEKNKKNAAFPYVSIEQQVAAIYAKGHTGERFSFAIHAGGTNVFNKATFAELREVIRIVTERSKELKIVIAADNDSTGRKINTFLTKELATYAPIALCLQETCPLKLSVAQIISPQLKKKVKKFQAQIENANPAILLKLLRATLPGAACLELNQFPTRQERSN